MNPSDITTRRQGWRRVAFALLLIAIWAGLPFADRTARYGSKSAGSKPPVSSTTVSGSSRALEGLPQTNSSFDGTSGRTVTAPLVSSAPAWSVSVAGVASNEKSLSLGFNGQHFGVDPQAPAALAECQRRLGEQGSIVALIGLTVMPDRAMRKSLSARGVELLDYVPDNGWIARVRGTRVPSTDSKVFCFQQFNSSLRIQSGLRELTLVHPNVSVYVHTVRDRPIESVLDALAQSGFDGLTVHAVGDRTHLAGTIVASRFPEFLSIVSAHPDTLWIEAGRAARLLNAEASRVTQSGSSYGATPFFERGIFGAGQVIAVCDTGLDVDSCFFRAADGKFPPVNVLHGLNTDCGARKVVAADFLDPSDDPANSVDWDNHGHGTAVAGTAAGSSLYAPEDPEADNGMAPGAKLIVQDAGYRGLDECAELPGLGCPVTNFYPALLQAAAQGATIHNDSWGDQEDIALQNIYSETCRELDLVTWSNKQFLVVCAAGNGYVNDSVGSPSTAKNGLSVAASLTGAGDGHVASYSSRGWASDGRFKPDLTAPGNNLRTAASDGDISTENCYRSTHSGTSFAAPVVSGLAALVRDYFVQGLYPTGHRVSFDRKADVSAALVKAVLINASAPMSEALAPPPSRDQGWGLVNLSQTLRLSSDGPTLLAVDVSPGFSQTPAFPHKIYLRLSTTNRPLKVTLVWSDYPASPGVDRHLVNDLDVRIRTPHLTFKGNQIVNGQSVPGGLYDRLNNVEQIEWVPEQAEIVEISVWAHRIVVGPQDFAFVATGDFEVISSIQDEDYDGLPDYWELWHFGSLEPLPGDDSDGDGASNSAEVAANTDPTHSESLARLEILSRDPNGVTLAMAVGEDRQYVLEHSNDGLPGGSWIEVSEPMFLADPVVTATLLFTDPTHPQKAGARGSFYRVKIDPVPLHQ